MKYYIIPVYGCTDPEPLIGPFKTYAGMLNRAREVKAEQREEDAIFWLRTEKGECPIVESFSNAELEG